LFLKLPQKSEITPYNIGI